MYIIEVTPYRKCDLVLHLYLSGGWHLVSATLEARIAEHGLPAEAFDWYLDLRRYGSVPHAGFGMGIERCVTWLCGLRHVRETIPFPRMLERLRP